MTSVRRLGAALCQAWRAILDFWGGAEQVFCYQAIMQEPSVRGSRLAIAAGLAAVLVVGGAGFLLGRETAPAPQAAAPSSNTVPVIPTQEPEPEVPPPPTIWGRAELLDLSRLAADRTAAGEAMPDMIRQGEGQRFDLVLPFGCEGPEERSASAMGWQSDQRQGALRVRVTPQTWSAHEWGLPAADGGKSQGFWISRPWSSAEQCPARSARPVAAGTEALALPAPTLAIAQFGGEDGQWRPFEKTQRFKPGEMDLTGGFVLRLRGRLDPLREGEVVRCVEPGGPQQRPICVIAARFEEVRLENGVTKEVLGVWDERTLQR